MPLGFDAPSLAHAVVGSDGKTYDGIELMRWRRQSLGQGSSGSGPRALLPGQPAPKEDEALIATLRASARDARASRTEAEAESKRDARTSAVEGKFAILQLRRQVAALPQLFGGDPSWVADRWLRQLDREGTPVVERAARLRALHEEQVRSPNALEAQLEDRTDPVLLADGYPQDLAAFSRWAESYDLRQSSRAGPLRSLVTQEPLEHRLAFRSELHRAALDLPPIGEQLARVEIPQATTGRATTQVPHATPPAESFSLAARMGIGAAGLVVLTGGFAVWHWHPKGPEDEMNIPAILGATSMIVGGVMSLSGALALPRAWAAARARLRASDRAQTPLEGVTVMLP